MQVKLTTTFVLYQPLALAGVVAAPPITGAVLSMLMFDTVADEAPLPALSRHEPELVADWPAPSPVRVWPATELTSMPDWTLPVSAQVKATVTSLLFQPLALASGERLP